MGNQLVLRRLPTSMSHDVFARTLALEDVLVSTAFGALAYGSTDMLQAWRRCFTSMAPVSNDIRFEFWPLDHVFGRVQREPDVFVLDRVRQQALIIEAKRTLPRADTLAQQLLEEGLAAHATHPGVRLHLLVVSDQGDATEAFQLVRTVRPRLFGSGMRHATWTAHRDFLSRWDRTHRVDARDRRLLADVLAVMAKYGR